MDEGEEDELPANLKGIAFGEPPPELHAKVVGRFGMPTEPRKVSEAFSALAGLKTSDAFKSSAMFKVDRLAKSAKATVRVRQRDYEAFMRPTLNMPDPKELPPYRTAVAAEETVKALARLVVEAEEAEQRERTMLHWTIAGVVLAGLAAIASIVAIVLTVALAQP